MSHVAVCEDPFGSAVPAAGLGPTSDCRRYPNTATASQMPVKARTAEARTALPTMLKDPRGSKRPCRRKVDPMISTARTARSDADAAILVLLRRASLLTSAHDWTVRPCRGLGRCSEPLSVLLMGLLGDETIDNLWLKRCSAD